MWPFSRPQVDEELRLKLNRRCGLAVRTLHNCRTANVAAPAACLSLEAQVVFCHAEAVCPKLAAAYAKCFRRVVNSAGELQYRECDKQLQAMRRCLRKGGIDPQFP